MFQKAYVIVLTNPFQLDASEILIGFQHTCYACKFLNVFHSFCLLHYFLQAVVGDDGVDDIVLVLGQTEYLCMGTETDDFSTHFALKS